MNYLKLYSDFLKKYLKPRVNIKVIFDSSDGTTGLVLRHLFAADKRTTYYVFMNAKPNGSFPAHGPNPLAESAFASLKKEILKRKADLGVIFDADGDRVFFLDNRGEEVDPDTVAFMLRTRFKKPFVTDTRNGYLLRGRGSFTSKSGTYFIKKLMRQKKASFGSERSGHYYFKDFFYSDSGILAAIHFINAVSEFKKKGKSLHDVAKQYEKYYRLPETNFSVDNKDGVIKTIEDAYKKRAIKISHLDGLSMELRDFWFNIRSSNTEPLLRLNMEAKNEEVLKKEFRKLEALIK